MSELRCCYCNKTNAELEPDDLRPYGVGGQPACCGCALSTPERKAEATRQFHARVDAIEAAGDVPVIGDHLYGVQPLFRRDD